MHHLLGLGIIMGCCDRLGIIMGWPIMLGYNNGLGTDICVAFISLF